MILIVFSNPNDSMKFIATGGHVVLHSLVSLSRFCFQWQVPMGLWAPCETLGKPLIAQIWFEVAGVLLHGKDRVCGKNSTLVHPWINKTWPNFSKKESIYQNGLVYDSIKKKEKKEGGKKKPTQHLTIPLALWVFRVSKSEYFFTSKENH